MQRKTVCLLWRLNDDDYYVKVKELVGVFSTKEKAVSRFGEIADQIKRNKPTLDVDYHDRKGGDWYDTEELVIDA